MATELYLVFIGQTLLTVFEIQQNHRLCKALIKLDNMGDILCTSFIQAYILTK